MMPDSFAILHSGEGEGASMAEKINDVSHGEAYFELAFPPMNTCDLATQRVPYSFDCMLPILLDVGRRRRDEGGQLHWDHLSLRREGPPAID
mgnify:CR=1 FL=1